MKLFLAFFIFVNTIIPANSVPFVGKSYIVLESLNGNIVSEKNSHSIQSVASISKIMTAIVAIEHGKMSDLYTIGEEASQAWGSGVYIHVGDQITLQDLLYGLLLRSGNDAANVIAKNIGGSIESFVSMMNQKAKELSMKETHFSNPTGLDEEDNGNQSSAYDMAMLMRYCSENPLFNDIVATKSYKREDGNGTWHNKNRLLTAYDYCVGGKTGYTKKAKRTLITRAVKDGISLIIVTFNCGNDFEFHQDMYEYCFNTLEKQMILNRGIYNYHGHSFLIDQEIYGLTKTEITFKEVLGGIALYSGDNYIQEVKNQNHIIFYYFIILLGEMVNG